MNVGYITLIVIISTFLGMLWMIQKAESGTDMLINAVLVLLAGIAVLVLIVLVPRIWGRAELLSINLVSLSSRLTTVDRQDNIPGLLLRFDIPGRLNHILQSVAPIDDRPVSPGLDKPLEEEDILLRVSRWYSEDHFLVPDPRG